MRPWGPGSFQSENGFGSMLLGRMGERLNLTDEQKDQIKAIVDANKENFQAAHEAVRKATKGLNEAAQGGVEAEIIAAGKAVGDAFTEQALQRANITKQVKAVLTEEQQTQLDEMRTQIKERMQLRQERRRDGEGPHGRGERSGRRSKNAK